MSWTIRVQGDKVPAHPINTCTFHADDIAASQAFRKSYETRTNVVKAEDMPWERSSDGLIKHLVHHQLNTRECCVEAYMQFLKAGERSGKHRHMWEEIIFVARRRRLRPALGSEVRLPRRLQMGMGRRAQEVRVEARRLHLHPAVHHAPAFRRPKTRG